MKQLALLISVFAVLIGGSLVIAVRVFSDVETTISWHGWFAMGLGVTFTVLVGAGLMYLVFYSARHGHDDIDHEL